MRNSNKDYKKLVEENEQLKEELDLVKRVVSKKKYLIESMDHEIQLLKMTDVLTGTYNKRYLYKKYQEAVTLHKRWGFKITLCSFDIDDLSSANETYGTDFGDSLLMSFSKLCSYLIRDDIDSLFRIAGDDFLVILVDCNTQNATKICQRIQREFNSITEGHTLSFGVNEIENLDDFSLENYLLKEDTNVDTDKFKEKN